MSAHSMEIPISRSYPKTRVDLLLFTFLITFLPKLAPAFEGRLHVRCVKTTQGVHISISLSCINKFKKKMKINLFCIFISILVVYQA